MLKNLKRRRQKAGLTQTQLAKEARVSQSLIAKIESGIIDPAYSKVELIKDALERIEKRDELKAKDVMCKKVTIAKPSDKVITVIKLMNSKAISQMPVVDGKNIIGLVSEKAILKRLGKEDVRLLKVQDVMENMPPIVGEETPLSVLNTLLQDSPLIVVGKMGKMKGVVAKNDVIKSMI